MKDAVYRLISDDPVLNAAPYLIDQDCVFPTFSLDGSRTIAAPNDKFFVIIRWELAQAGFAARTTFSVWVHQPRELGTSFTNIDNALKRIREILQAAVHVVGADGGKLTQARFEGYGAEQADAGYDTICRYAAFTGLSGESLTG